MTIRRYLTHNAGLLAVLVLGLFLFNLLVDAYGCYGIVNADGFNRIKNRAVGRAAKSILVECGDYNAMIFGSSRTEFGLPAAHPAWDGARVFNFSFASAHMEELLHALRYVLRRHRPRRIVLGLDFFMFGDRPFPPEFRQSFFHPSRTRRPNLFDNTLSFPATRNSLLTLSDNLRPSVRGLAGRMTARNNAGQTSGKVRRRFREVLSEFLNKRDLYREHRTSAGALDALARFIAEATAGQAELTLVINPPHALMMEVLRHRGLWAEFEDWKRQVTALAWGDGSGPVPLFDFSGYNALTSEAVPGANSGGKAMLWFHEASHFHHALGGLMLERIYRNPERSEPPGGFGARLTPSNLERHLAAIRTARKRFVTNHPAEVAWIEHLAR